MVRLEKYRMVVVWILAFLLLCSTGALLMSIVEDRAALANTDSIRRSGAEGMAAERALSIPSDHWESETQKRLVQIVENSDGIDDARDINLGEAMQGSRIQQIFAVRNSTNKPLTVTDVKKSCGCQTLQLPKGTILPAGKVLKFAYGIPSSLLGHQSGKLVIHTDSANESLRVITFTLQADVRAVITTTPSAIHFDHIPSVGSTGQELRVTSFDSELLSRFSGATATKKVVHVTLEKQTPELLLIRVDVLPGTAPGRFNDFIMLKFDSHDQKPVTVFVPVDGVIATR